MSKPVLTRKKVVKDVATVAVTPSVPEVPAFLARLDCDCCQQVRAELLGSLQRSVSKMQEIAADGKGHEFEAENNTEYNRYFGCAIACDTMLKAYFNFPKTASDEVGEGDAAAE